jgi:hypothetical protein
VRTLTFESFNSRLRDECLNEHAFLNLAEAREIIAGWCHDYNHALPHSSRGALTPIELRKNKVDRPLELVWGFAAVPLLNRLTRGIT